jgi:hypothetical protein
MRYVIIVRVLTEQQKHPALAGFFIAMEGREVYPDIMSIANNRREDPLRSPKHSEGETG